MRQEKVSPLVSSAAGQSHAVAATPAQHCTILSWFNPNQQARTRQPLIDFPPHPPGGEENWKLSKTSGLRSEQFND